MTQTKQKELLKSRWEIAVKMQVPRIYLDEVYRDLNRGIQKIDLSVNDIK